MEAPPFQQLDKNLTRSPFPTTVIGMDQKTFEKGFTHLVLVLAVAFITSVILFTQIPISRHYASGQSSVAGVEASPNQTKELKVLSSGDKTAFVQGVSGAVSEYPIKFDEKSGAILVTTPLGVKSVAVLPEAAVKSALYGKVIDNVGSVDPKGVFASVNQLVRLENKGGVLAYFIKGEKEYKILGLVSVKFNVSTFVSAENGQVMESKTSLLSRILSRLAS